jgi:predicted enzyme related to lactoylglutathione lyase
MTEINHAPGSFCWFECGTTDSAAAKKFYTELFGWSVEDHPMPGGMEGHYTILRLGEHEVAGLYQMSGPQLQGVPSHWATYVKVESTDETAKKAVSIGGQILVPPMDVPGVGRMAVVQDPTGATISLFQCGEHPGMAQLGFTPGTFGWSELATRDTDTAAGFYTGLFGWEAKSDEGGPMPYTEFQVGGRSIGGMMEMTECHGDAPPHWTPYVMVKDCDAVTTRAGELGGNILVPPTDIPEVGRFSVLQDPTGAVLATIAMNPEHCAE